jgi:hypothetical protein
VALANNDVIDICLDLGTKQIWWSKDGTTWWGAGGTTTNTTADVIAGTGGWTASAEDNRTRSPGMSLNAATQAGQILAGSNVTRSPPSGFTVLP